MNLDLLLYWMRERESIRRRRLARELPPWTRDPILQQWSFCNVRREHDRVTRWIAANWRYPHADDPDLWFAMVVARFMNEPDTLREIGFPVPLDPERFLRVMASRRARGAKLYRNDAYRIRADNRLGRPTPEYRVADVFGPLWRNRREMRPRTGETLASYHRRLGRYHGMGDGFMSAQIVADLKFVPPLRSAYDWMTFAVSGSGSRQGLNRVLGRPVDAPWTEAEWRREFDRLREAIMPELQREGLGDLSAQDLQNCLCEADKYERVLLDEGAALADLRGVTSLLWPR